MRTVRQRQSGKMQHWIHCSRTACLGVLFAGLGAVSCGAGGGGDVESLDNAEQAIINGTTVTVDRYYTPFISTPYGTCSGTMIGDRWVLTAHHCVTVEENMTTGGTSVADNEVSARLLNGASSWSSKVFRHPTLDVALVFLSTPLVPAGAKPVELYHDRVASLNGLTVYCQGWGRNTMTGGGGTLRWANIPIVMPNSTGPDSLFYLNPNDAGQIPWRGDSGGGCFFADKVLGVASWVRTLEDASHNPISVLYATEVGADFFHDWAMTTMGKVVSGVRGKCLDLQDSNTANGTPVRLNDCNGSQAQTWTPVATSDGSIRGTIRAFGKCLDVAGGATANGTTVQLWDCNGTAAQTWDQQGNGTLLNPQSGRCLGVPTGATSGQLQILDCNTDVEQQWTLTARTKIIAATKIEGLCLDVRNGSTASGTAVQTASCTGNANQTWILNSLDSSLRAYGKCLDVTGGAQANGTPLQLWDCNGTDAQKWTAKPNGSLYNSLSGRCLDIPNGSSNPGTQVQIWDCNATNAQLWTFKNIAKTITFNLANLCMDVRGGSNASGTPVQLYTCNGTNPQKWMMENETIRSLGKCLDVQGGGTTNGTALQLWDCNGTASQQWVARADGSLYNPQSGRCMDDPNASTAAGTQLQIWDCNGTDAQKWIIQ